MAIRALVNIGTRRCQGHITSFVLQPPLSFSDPPFLLLNDLALVFFFVFSVVCAAGTFLTQV